ncbi:hypothetical protein ABZ490_44050 [Streptomyces sp. NPDC005811]|uniref:hypothetical protein n=1 Tax=Streptomyces sp. NPDC005811 TaxID=3154565 RepID=UPI0033D12DB5
MTVLAVSLNVVAAVLELAGVVLTVIDIRGARRRLAGYLHRTRTVYASGRVTASASIDLTVTRANSTLEERIDDLETRQRNLPAELDALEKRIVERLSSQFSGALKTTEQTINDELTGLRDYIAGREDRWWPSYRGPIILVGGILVGLAGNIASSL